MKNTFILLTSLVVLIFGTAFKTEPGNTILFTGNLFYAEGDCLQVTGHQKAADYSTYTGYVFFVKKSSFDQAMKMKGKANWEEVYKASPFAWSEEGNISIKLPADSFVVIPEMQITSKHYIYLNTENDTVNKQIRFFRCISQ